MAQTLRSGESLRHLILRCRRRWQLFLFLLLPVAWVLLFHYVPMTGIQIAFKRYNMKDGINGSEWVGLANFSKFFASYQCRRVIVNTLRVSFYSLLAGFPLPILLALGLNAMNARGYKKFLQTLTYLPHFISTVVLVGMIVTLFNINTGLYGKLGWLFAGHKPGDIFIKDYAFPHLYVWSGVWQGMGWSSIIYMASLASVDVALHEAAQIDGASRFQRCVYIDFPCILPTAVILLIMNAGNIMSIGFEKVYLMQNSLNLTFSEVISTYVYKVSLQDSSDFSYGTAIGLFNSVVNLLMLATVNGISKRVTETSLW